MKRFNIKRYVVPVWVMMVLAVVLLIASPVDPDPQSSVFCAYGKVFVEFEQGSKTWGTMMLNDYGKPIPCEDPTKTPVVNLEKSSSI